MALRSIVFWNVQRLFEPGSRALDALIRMSGGDPHEPTAPEAVEAKVALIGAVLDRISADVAPPLLVALAEIETSRLTGAVAAATGSVALRDADIAAVDDYGFALQGLNLAVLFDDGVFTDPTVLRTHVVDRTFDTRDVLELRLPLRGATEELSVLVNHWPSRLAAEGAEKRLAAAYYVQSLLRDVVRIPLSSMWRPEGGGGAPGFVLPSKEELVERGRRPLIVLGDFNDDPFDRSLTVLGATPDVDEVLVGLRSQGRTREDRLRAYQAWAPTLLNPFWAYTTGALGTYYRSPRWRTYDQVLVSSGIVDGAGPLRYVPGSAHPFVADSVTLAGRNVPMINRGGKPLAYDSHKRRGCSDHFPAVLEVEI